MNVPRFDLATAPLDAGTLLLEASAGTGKTYTIIGLLLRLLFEQRIPSLDRALVVTFTVAATEELKQRLRRGLQTVLAAAEGAPCRDPLWRRLAQRPDAAARARAALDDFDRVPIATIHGFCKRLLDESAFETRQPFRLDFVVDPLPLLHRAAADVVRRRYAAEPDATHALLALGKLTPEALASAWLLWRRHPDIALEPNHPDAAAHTAAIAAPLARAAAGCDAACLARIASFQWLKDDCPFENRTDVEPELQRFAAQLRTAPVLALPLVVRLGRRRLGKSLKKNSQRPDGHPFFDDCDAAADAVDAALVHLRAQLLQDLDERLARDKQRQHVLSFDDLLQRAHAALQDPARRDVLLAAIRERHEVALIDEFQDTDALQYEIFATCFAQRPLFLVGDPKQSIYGFRGADLDAYFAARRDAATVGTLDTNFRSSGPLVAAVSHLFGPATAFVDAGITLPVVHASAAPGALALDGDPGPAFRWRLLGSSDGEDPTNLTKEPSEARIAADVAAEVARLLAGPARIDDRRLLPRDCAVLTRTNRQAVRVQEALRDAGIVSAIGKAGDIFDTDEIVDVERLLRAIVQPRDLALARSAMATRLWGRDATWVHASLSDDEAFDGELRRLEEWRRLWHRHGFVAMAERLLGDLGVVPRLLAQRGGERSLTNYRQLFELLHQAEHDERLSAEGLLEWLLHERRHKDELDYQLRELRLESDEDAVQILTVHGSKGLQYEVVFCPFLWDARRDRAPAIVPLPGARRLAFELDTEAKAALEVARQAEDVRLCYVALTRARRRTYVHVGPCSKDAPRSALAWLLWPPPVDLELPQHPERFATWSDRAKQGFPHLRARLDELCAASGGTMGVDLVPVAPTAAPLPPMPVAPLGPARTAQRLLAPRALHSFSSLVAGAHGLEPGPDVADPAARHSQTISAAPARGIFAFARGARAGQCLHTLLEHADLDALQTDAAAALVRQTLQAYGLADPAAHTGALDPVADVLQNLKDLAAARVHAGGPTVAELARGPKAIEWKFTLPTPGSSLEALAAAFARHGSALAQRYADRLRRLPPRTLHGFLVGFVDLCATHGERHWIVDWKSNHLGDRAADYGPDALATAMVDSDYVLQYHLYVLALHRQLRARLPGYDYDRHQGGIAYAFLRGVRPDDSNGMLFDRVPRALVEAMDRWAGGGR
ncbi:MAG: UvrD-helicase domain-containing protein [Planctomycetes bacterium]|nr:UvrD-helicase domain-containing protein [Planctomycetota bacterium]